ncbi:MAG: methionyl-tRNA formyltransferase [Planctomycetota bacterium]|nr:MAG: methionyl-tRNA formyltransferase [Planctomycetota bacterium]
MRIVFFGSGAFGLPTIEMLAREHELVRVISQPDRKAGRGGRLTPTPISQWALENGLSDRLDRPDSINTPATVEHVRSLDAEVWVVIAYGQKLSGTLLANRFAINLHASLLPRWRGAAPINAAILAGDTVTGNSVITLADRMDAGLVLGQSQRPIDPELTAGELHDLLAADGPDLVRRVLVSHETDTLTPVPQDESRVTRAPKLSRRDAWIDLTRPAEEVRRRVHGLTPWPGVGVRLGNHEVKLLRVKAETIDPQSERRATGGAVIDVEQGLFACAQGSAIRIIELQPAGKRAMTWEQFVRGRSIAPSAVLSSLQERP